MMRAGTVATALALCAIPLMAASPVGAAAKCPHDARVARDVPYRTVEGVDPNMTSLDVYEPAARGKCKPAPIVMWVHGGGWMIGNKRHAVADKVRLFNEAGYVFISVNYRLTDTSAAEPVQFPTHNEDVAAAVAWVVEHAADYGGDPDRIALLGHSAGAAIVASVGTDERYLAEYDLDLSALRCVVPIDTEGFDVAASAASPGRLGSIYRAVFGDDPATWEEASPLQHVEAGKHIPDMLLVERGFATRRAKAEQFAAALRAAEVDVTIVDADGLTHADVNKLIGAPGDDVMTPAVTTFLDGCFE